MNPVGGAYRILIYNFLKNIEIFLPVDYDGQGVVSFFTSKLYVIVVREYFIHVFDLNGVFLLRIDSVIPILDAICDEGELVFILLADRRLIQYHVSHNMVE